MLNFGRRDRIADPKHADKGVLKPALYDPPGAPGRAAATSAPGRPAPMPPTAPPQPPASSPPVPPAAGAAGEPPAPATKPAEPSRSKLVVGINIQLKGVEITECDAVVIEGHVEATVRSKAMEIAKPGTLKGTAFIDVAEIHGEFEGELTAHTRLVVHGTGRVSGTIRYGKLVVEEGGELSGDVKHIDEATERVASTLAAGSPVGAGAAGTAPPR
jgi:cytoskeletal protein CcmA (bactofilin family)